MLTPLGLSAPPFSVFRLWDQSMSNRGADATDVVSSAATTAFDKRPGP